MCGIAGLVDFVGTPRESALRRHVDAMSTCLSHRGPDDQGSYIDEAHGVALGHRRLSIIDLSPEGHQPMASADGRFWIVFNGEIYNFQDLRRELEALGAKFRGHSDTEVMLAGFTAWGVQAAVERFVGMFAFALWDRQKNELHLVRDRLGKKPLYYALAGNTLLFGSELKALWAHPAFRPTIDRGAIALFVRHACIPGPHTIFEAVHKLPPAAILTVRVTRTVPTSLPEPTAYWSAHEIAEAGRRNPFSGTEREAVDALDSQLRVAVAQRMIADVPLGAFLSGGVDSSLIVALMQAQSDRPVRTFTIGFEDENYNEAELARGVAEHLGTQHSELYVTPEMALATIPDLARIFDEPFADSSQIPTLLVSRLARKHVTVALTGDGGDELFGGYNRYNAGARLQRALPRIPQALRNTLARGLDSLPPAAVDRLGRRVGTLLGPQRRPRGLGEKAQKAARILRSQNDAETYLTLVSNWQEPELVVLDANEPPTLASDRAAWPDLATFEDQMMYLDQVGYLTDDILAKVDRASMSVGLEIRAPLLDQRVVEFAWRLDSGLKVRRGTNKWILRELLDRYVPRRLVDRPKMGFSVPLAAWLRGPLRDWGEALLDPARLREEGFFKVELVREIWTQHAKGERDRQHELWAILMFQAWLEANPSNAAQRSE